MESLKIVISWQLCNFTLHFLADSNSDTATEKARLRFAHAETVIPFICLLGLFLDDVDVKSIQSEEPFQAPPRPPKHRVWRGAMVAPFGANTALVLHKCSLDNGTGEEFLVQALHNEKSVSMPGCNGTHFCPIEMFKVRSLSIFDHYIKCSNSCTFVFNGPSVFSCSPSVSWSLCIME
jgi:hypothetical protein